MILNELKLYPDMSDIARQRLKIRMRGILNNDLEVLVIAQLLQIFFRLHLQFGLKRTQQREFHVEYRHSLTVPEKVPQYTETKTNIHEGRSDLSLHFLFRFSIASFWERMKKEQLLLNLFLRNAMTRWR